MSAHGGLDSQGHPGCGLGAERGPVWEGQAESGQRRRGCRPRGKRMGALGPWTRRKVGARKSGSDLGFSRIDLKKTLKQLLQKYSKERMGGI